MTLSRILRRAPYILAIAYTIFISLFALDVFTEMDNPLEMIVALFMHLIPTYFLIAAIFLAWKKPRIGGLVFLLLAIVFTIFFHTFDHGIAFLIISMPLFVIGTLFLFLKRR